MGNLLGKIGIGAGAAILGSVLFPETAGMLTGGLLGTSSAGISGIGPVTSGADYSGMLAGAAGGTSIWSNPTVLSSGILAGTSLLSGLFGSNSADDLNKATLEEKKREFDAQQALAREQLAQSLEIAKMQTAAAGAGAGAAGKAAGITAAANKSIAKANAIGQAAGAQAQALQIPLAARGNQMSAAQNTGAQSGAFFNTLMAGLQRPALGVA